MIQVSRVPKQPGLVATRTVATQPGAAPDRPISHEISGGDIGQKDSACKPVPIRDEEPGLKGEYDIMYTAPKDNDTLRLNLLKHVMR